MKKGYLIGYLFVGFLFIAFVELLLMHGLKQKIAYDTWGGVCVKLNVKVA